MHSVRRVLTLLAIVATLAMLSATVVLAKDKDHTVPVSGSSSGTSTVVITPARTCNPVPPVVHATDLLCTFTVDGRYSASGIGSGAYHGTTMIDYTQYGSAGLGPGACTPVTGSITFQKSPGNTLTITLGAGSRVCDTSPASTVHNTHLVLDITGGTGRFAGATGTILSDGTSTDDAASAGLHHDQAHLSGQVTLNHDGDDGGDD